MIPPPPGAALRPELRHLAERGTAMEQVRQEIEDRSYRAVSNVQVFRCECQRCGHVWHTLQQTRPRTCSNCRSPWWDRAKTVNVAPVVKGKKRKRKTGGKPGRPRKYARREVEAGGGVAVGESSITEVPEVPVGLLGSVGGIEDASGGVGGGGTGEVSGAVSVASSGGDGAFVSDGGSGGGDTGVAAGQSVDGGGSAGVDGSVEHVRTVICTDPAHMGGLEMHGCCTGWSDDDWDD